MKFADKQAALETADVLVVDDGSGDVVLARQLLKHGGACGVREPEFAELPGGELLGGVVVAMLNSSSAQHDRIKSSRDPFVIDYSMKPLGITDLDRLQSGIETQRLARHQS